MTNKKRAVFLKYAFDKLEENKLNSINIKSLVKEKYGIEINSVKRLNSGSANIYKLKSKNGEYILKEFQLKYKKESIDKEVRIINHLSKDNIKVPIYVRLINGDYSFTYGGHIIIMQKFIEGDVLEKNKCNLEQTLESARYLGKIVNSLENFPHEHDYSYSSWVDTNFVKSINKHLDMIKQIGNDVPNEFSQMIIGDLDDKIKIMKELSKKDFPDIDKITVKYTHGDYNVMQFIYFKDKINAIIDFVSACEMPVSWEIIRSYSYIYLKNANGEFDVDAFILYVKEFLKYSSLNEYDMQYMPYIYLNQLLKSLFGYQQYIESGNIELLKFGFYRTKICRNLYKNIDEIVKKLREEI